MMVPRLFMWTRKITWSWSASIGQVAHRVTRLFTSRIIHRVSGGISPSLRMVLKLPIPQVNCWMRYGYMIMMEAPIIYLHCIIQQPQKVLIPVKYYSPMPWNGTIPVNTWCMMHLTGLKRHSGMALSTGILLLSICGTTPPIHSGTVLLASYLRSSLKI